MNSPRAEELQTILGQGRWDQAVAILQRLDPTVAADTFVSLPHEEQKALSCDNGRGLGTTAVLFVCTYSPNNFRKITAADFRAQ